MVTAIEGLIGEPAAHDDDRPTSSIAAFIDFDGTWRPLHWRVTALDRLRAAKWASVSCLQQCGSGSITRWEGGLRGLHPARA